MTERELIRRLENSPVPPPPEDLAARVINDIPSEIELHPAIEHEEHRKRFHRRPVWMAAAAIVTVALTGAVTWELRKERSSFQMTGVENRQLEVVESLEVGGEFRDVEVERDAVEGKRRDKQGLDHVSPPLVPSEAEFMDSKSSDPSVSGKGRQEGSTGRSRRVVIADHSPIEQPSPAVHGQLQSPEVPVLEESAVIIPSPPERRAREVSAMAPGVDTARVQQVSDRGVDEKSRFGKNLQSKDGVERHKIDDEATVSSNAPLQLKVSKGYLAIPDPSPEKKGEIGEGFVQPSAGGTREPNDQPYGDVFFKHTGVNPFVDTEDDHLSTFGLDVDTGSFTVARQYLNDGRLPPHAAIRVEEFVNSFDYRDKAPRKHDFRLIVEGAPSAFASSERTFTLRMAVKARDVDAASRPPAILVFCVDVSGSMERENRLGLVKKALHELLENLRRDDYVGLVVYGSSGKVLLRPTTDHGEIGRAIDQLRAGGSTNVEEGLVLAYDLLNDGGQDGRIRRVILCSDGVANVGKTGPDDILERIRSEAGAGIELTTVGFGMGNYNDILMERLADSGDGRYAYVDELSEARRIFVEELTGTLLTLGHDAKAQVEFDPQVVSRWRLLGYENRDIADHLFRDPTVDAGEIGAGHTVTAIYEVKLRPGVSRSEKVAVLNMRYRPLEREDEIELNEVLRVSDLKKSWEEASPALKLASSVAEFAEILKGAYWAKDGDLDDVLRRLQHLQSGAFEGDGRVAELGAMVAKARSITQN